MPERHICEVDVSEVDSTEGVWGAVSVEESPATIGFWEKDAFVRRDDVSFKEAAEVCLDRVEIYVGCGAGVGVLWPDVDLLPEDVCLDNGRDTAFWEGLGDYVSAIFFLEVAF